MQYLGLWVLIALTLNMWALIGVLRSGARRRVRAVWTLILMVPVLGFVAWFLLGPRSRTA